jgi:hypothetical protein
MHHDVLLPLPSVALHGVVVTRGYRYSAWAPTYFKHACVICGAQHLLARFCLQYQQSTACLFGDSISLLACMEGSMDIDDLLNLHASDLEEDAARLDVMPCPVFPPAGRFFYFSLLLLFCS